MLNKDNPFTGNLLHHYLKSLPLSVFIFNCIFMNIAFLGAAREVTGSKHLITTKHGKRILLDCGMYQGKGLETDALNRNLGFDPA